MKFKASFFRQQRIKEDRECVGCRKLLDRKTLTAHNPKTDVVLCCECVWQLQRMPDLRDHD